jgi:hypothetical protein
MQNKLYRVLVLLLIIFGVVFGVFFVVEAAPVIVYQPSTVNSSSSTMKAGLHVDGNLSVSSTATIASTTITQANIINLDVKNCTGCGGAGSGASSTLLADFNNWSNRQNFLGGFISNASSSFSAGLQVAGALSASGTLQAAGATTLASTLNVNALSVFNGFISNASSSVTGLQVAGNLSSSSTATFNTVSSNLIPTTNNTYDVGSYTASWKNIYVSSTLFTQSLNAVLTATIGGNTTIGGTLGVTGLSTFTGFISTASSTVSAGLQVSGNLSVSSTMTVAGATFASTINVTGLSTLTGFISTASSTVSAGLQVAGAFNASSTLNVSGAASLASTLGVTGLSTLSGLISTASSSFNAGVQVSGNLSVSSTLTAASTVELSAATVVQHLPLAFSFPASTVTTTAVSTTLPLGVASPKETWNNIVCFSKSGTIGFQLTDGTNAMNFTQATTTVSQFSLTTNNVLAKFTKRYVTVGPMTNDQLSCTGDRTINK